MKSKLTAIQREKINQYIKNGIDISPLIQDYDIRGEDFTGAIIKTFSRPDEDISGVILANCIIGEDGKVTNINRTIMRNSNLIRSIWKGEVWARMADVRNSALTEAFFPNVDYRYADLRNCDFCGTVFQIATPKALGAKFSEDFFKDLAKFWGIEITIKHVNNV